MKRPALDSPNLTPEVSTPDIVQPILHTHKYGTILHGPTASPLMSELPSQASKQTLTQSTSAGNSTTPLTWTLLSPVTCKIAGLKLLDIV